MVTQFLQLIDNLLAGAAIAQRLLAFWGPVVPAPTLFGPLLALGSVIALALLSGLAVGSVATLIVALVALYFIVTEIFGVAIEINAIGQG